MPVLADDVANILRYYPLYTIPLLLFIMLSSEQMKELLDAHHDFIQTSSAELIDLLNLVERVIPDVTCQEHKDWTTHMGRLCDVWQRRTEGEDNLPWPDVCLESELIEGSGAMCNNASDSCRSHPMKWSPQPEAWVTT